MLCGREWLWQVKRKKNTLAKRSIKNAHMLNILLAARNFWVWSRRLLLIQSVHFVCGWARRDSSTCWGTARTGECQSRRAHTSRVASPTVFYSGRTRSSGVLRSPPTRAGEERQKPRIAAHARGHGAPRAPRDETRLRVLKSFCVFNRVLPETRTRGRRRGCAAGAWLWLGRGSTLLCALITRWEATRQPIRVYVHTV